jgi:hypothetical protein
MTSSPNWDLKIQDMLTFTYANGHRPIVDSACSAWNDLVSLRMKAGFTAREDRDINEDLYFFD